jgi:sugar/nucleoside kinase (ribokinase family)
MAAPKAVPVGTSDTKVDTIVCYRCSAWPLNQRDIVDSTGAGDAFIGGFLGGMAWRFTDEVGRDNLVATCK